MKTVNWPFGPRMIRWHAEKQIRCLCTIEIAKFQIQMRQAK